MTQRAERMKTMKMPIETVLESQFDRWFAELQKLTPEKLTPEDWAERWFDGYTPEDALEDGPEAP